MKPAIIPHDLTGKALYTFLVKNEALIFHAKKSEIKIADASTSQTFFINEKGALVSKAQVTETNVDPTKIKVVVVINSTNWFDSHGDVHIPGLWKKSLADNKKNGFYLLKIHQATFEGVIGENCEGVAKSISWKELEIDLPGTTEALVFTGIIEAGRNPYMFDQYRKGYVKQHSVGMRYVKMVTCINDEDYPVQKENWDKYITMVANRADAEASGYFWAVLEAKVMEGSAVLFGSNCMTPTALVEDYDDNSESTKNQPPPGTGNEPPFDLSKALLETKFFNN